MRAFLSLKNTFLGKNEVTGNAFYIFSFLHRGILASRRYTVNAQELNFGAHSGINFSNFAEGCSRNAYDNSNKLGYEIGGDLRLTWNNGINLSSGISFSQTGGKFAALSDYLDETGKMVTEYPEINIKTLSVGYQF